MSLLNPNIKKPCPKCNSTYLLQVKNYNSKFPQYYIACRMCGYESKHKLSMKRAIRHWNKIKRGDIND